VRNLSSLLHMMQLIHKGGRLIVTEEVEHALQNGHPVIALESTIITHGGSLVASLG
jgi:pseudouridine-5'-phosphate glycosidase